MLDYNPSLSIYYLKGMILTFPLVQQALNASSTIPNPSCMLGLIYTTPTCMWAQLNNPACSFDWAKNMAKLSRANATHNGVMVVTDSMAQCTVHTWTGLSLSPLVQLLLVAISHLSEGSSDGCNHQ